MQINFGSVTECKRATVLEYMNILFFRWKTKEFYLPFLPEALFFPFSITQNHSSGTEVSVLSDIKWLQTPATFVLFYFAVGNPEIKAHSAVVLGIHHPIQFYQFSDYHIKCKYDHNQNNVASDSVKRADLCRYPNAGQNNNNQQRFECVRGGECLLVVQRINQLVGNASTKQGCNIFLRKFLFVRLFVFFVTPSRTTCLKRSSQYTVRPDPYEM